MFDTDKSGNISIKEVETGMHSMGYYPSQKWLADTVYQFDEDGNDQIEFEEFVAMYQFLRKEHIMNPATALEDALRYEGNLRYTDGKPKFSQLQTIRLFT